MKTYFQILLLAFFWLTSVIANGQQPDPELQKIQTRLQQIERANLQVSKQIKATENRLSGKLATATDSLTELKNDLAEANKTIKLIRQELDHKISKAEKTADGKIASITTSLSQNTLYGIIAVLIIALLSVGLFALLRSQFVRRNTDLSESIDLTNRTLEKQHSSLSDSIQTTKKALEEEGIRLDTKLADILEAQLSLLKNTPAQAKTDHSLALKMADEINRIQKNLNHMDPSTKGLKQLNGAVRRILENFESNGYKLVELLNKPYDQGMNAIAVFRPDEQLKADEKIISKIIKPQVNFRGVMIQSAEIEVSFNE